MAKAEKPRRLGRGLSSLISQPVEVETNPKQSTNIPAASQASPVGDAGTAVGESPGGVRMLPLDSIVPNRFQPRRLFDEDALRRLASSIARSGMMHPILVRPLASGADAPDGAAWELIAGERRWRAALIAGLMTAPAVVSDIDDREAAEWSLIENIQREDLNPIDRAWGFRRLQQEFSLSHAQIAERMEVDRSSVTNLIRLTELESELQDLVASGQIGAGHAKALLSVGSNELRLVLAARTLQMGWSVRRLEAEVTRIQSGKGPTPAAVGDEHESEERMIRDAPRRDLERRLGDLLGTRVRLKIRPGSSRGRVEIEFYDFDQLEGLISRIGGVDADGSVERYDNL